MTRRKAPSFSRLPTPTSAFIMAAKYSNLKMVKEYLDKGVDPNVFWDENNALFIAVEASNLNLLLLLTYYKNLDLNIQNLQGDTPLMLACTMPNNTKIVQILLKAGSDPNKENKFGRTPLHAAVHQDSIDICKMLLDYNARINVFDEFGNTPLYFACIENKSHSMVKFLLQKGADPNMRSSLCLPLFLEVCLSCTKDDLSIVELLLAVGADYTICDSISKKNALHFAAQVCNGPLVSMLLSIKFDVFQKDGSGRNPMMIAKQHQCTEVMCIFSDYLVGLEIQKKKK